jgi:membrane associated rhomboid family serine protease
MAGAALALFHVSPAGASLAYVPSSPTLLGLLACHFVHFSVQHAIWDVLTFALLSSWVERELRPRHALFMVLAIGLVPPFACALTPWVRAYAGLSGLVLGQLALLLASRARDGWLAKGRTRTAGSLTLLALLLVKQVYEFRIGDTSLITMNYRGFSTVPAAHLVSVLLGVGVGCLGRELELENCASIFQRLRRAARRARGRSIAIRNHVERPLIGPDREIAIAIRRLEQPGCSAGSGIAARVERDAKHGAFLEAREKE